jgi:deoxyadenosine/deoxycytidine kinase/nucleoside 2-deoxyribosyltransferase
VQVRRPRAYYAAGLFNEAERAFNLRVKAMLDELGYEVWFPQEDAGFLEDYMDQGMTLAEARHQIFTMNKLAVAQSDVLIFNLDGRVPDEGACVEAGYAHGLGIRCIGLQTDFRAVEPGGNNLMLDGILAYQVASSIDQLREMLDTFQVEVDLTGDEPAVTVHHDAELPYVAVAGPLGVGKTSLIDRLATNGEWAVLEEPVDENPYLDDVYHNLPDLGFRMQTYYLGRRAAQHQTAARRTRRTLQERSILEDAHVFFPAYRDAGAYDDNDLATLMTLYEATAGSLPMPDLIVSVEASLDTCVRRIKERDRVAEREIDQDWLRIVHDRYAEWLGGFADIPTVSISSEDLDYVSAAPDAAEAVRTISRALRRTGSHV